MYLKPLAFTLSSQSSLLITILSALDLLPLASCLTPLLYKFYANADLFVVENRLYAPLKNDSTTNTVLPGRIFFCFYIIFKWLQSCTVLIETGILCCTR